LLALYCITDCREITRASLPSQLSDQRFRHAVGKVFLFGVADRVAMAAQPTLNLGLAIAITAGHATGVRSFTSTAPTARTASAPRAASRIKAFAAMDSSFLLQEPPGAVTTR